MKKYFHHSYSLFSLFAFALLLSGNKEQGNKTVNDQYTAVTGNDADIEIIRKRIIDDLLAPAVETRETKELIRSIQPDGSWPGINYKDVSRTGFQHSRHLENMLSLARAFRKPGTEFYLNAEVKKTVSAGPTFGSIMTSFVRIGGGMKWERPI